MPTIRPKFNYRQAGGSKIAEFANMVCRGDMPALRNEGDFEFVPVEDGDQGAEAVLALVNGIVSEGYGLLDWQVLAPMRRGSCGVTKLNEQLRELVNPARPGAPTLGQYRLGDKVMVIKNHYGLGVFNGDLGIVKHVEKIRFTVILRRGLCRFCRRGSDILTLAHASMIHKSQGSEFSIVIMPLCSSTMSCCSVILYTGMDEGKAAACAGGGGTERQAGGKE